MKPYQMRPEEAWSHLTKTNREHEARARKRKAEAEAEFSYAVKGMAKDMHNAACIDEGHYAKKTFMPNSKGRPLDIKIFHGKD